MIVQLYDKYFPSYLESWVFCFLVNGLLTCRLKSPFTGLASLCHHCVVIVFSHVAVPCIPSWGRQHQSPSLPEATLSYHRTSPSIKEYSPDPVLAEGVYYSLKQHLTLSVPQFGQLQNESHDYGILTGINEIMYGKEVTAKQKLSESVCPTEDTGMSYPKPLASNICKCG